ncbi:MAG: DUF2384 domain-containing protein [Saprospiraceae bacterium]|nr:DUF2384 domain-containing protein [Saprospiraceae bacterium]
MKTYPILEDAITTAMEPILDSSYSKGVSVPISAIAIPSNLYTHPLSLSRIVQAGIPFPLFQHIYEVAPLTEKEWCQILDISDKTLSRYAKEGPDFRFRRLHSERILEIARFTDLGMAFFDSKEAFRMWLDRNNHIFRNEKPIDLLNDMHGIGLLCEELGRMEHGIFP